MPDKLSRTLFCPFGIFGKCYVVPTPEKSAEIARFEKWFGRIGTLTTLVVMGVYGAFYGFAVCALVVVVFVLKHRRWQSEMTVCDPDLVPRFGEIRPADWTRMGKVRLGSLLGICIVMLGGAAWLFVNGMILPGMAILLFSGIGIVAFGWKLLLVFKTPAPRDPSVQREG